MGVRVSHLSNQDPVNQAREGGLSLGLGRGDSEFCWGRMKSEVPRGIHVGCDAELATGKRHCREPERSTEGASGVSNTLEGDG